MFSTTPSVNISNTTRYFTPSNDRNPNSAPPPRPNYFPMSSQPSSSSSPTKLSSSAQVRHILSPSNDVFGHPEYTEQVAEEEDEDFGGLEEMTNTQWINEVPSSPRNRPKSRTRSRSRRESSGIDPEMLDLDYDYHDAEVDVDTPRQGQRIGESSRRGSMLFPSQNDHHDRVQEHGHLSSSMRTPAGSYSFSDPTTLGAPITPSTPHHGHSSPASSISWSPSPLSSRSRRKAHSDTITAKGKGVMVEASDEDDVDDDKENISPNMSSPILRPKSTGKGKGKARRIIQSSDDDEDSEDDIPLAARSRIEGKGKGKEVELPVELLDVNLEESEPIKSSTWMARDTTGDDQHHNHDEDDDDFDDDIFEDAWANADLDFELAQLEEANAARSATSTTTTPSTFPTFTSGDAITTTSAGTITRPSPAPPIAPKFDGSAAAPQPQSKDTYSHAPGGSILDVLTETTSSLVYIRDLEPMLQEFYNNHWRRGADKEKAKTNKRQLIGEIDEDDESGEEEERTVKKKVPVKRGWAGRGGWRGRGRARGAIKRRR